MKTDIIPLKWKNSGLLYDLTIKQEIELANIFESVYQIIKDEPSQLYHVILYPEIRIKYLKDGKLFDVKQYIDILKQTVNIN